MEELEVYYNGEYKIEFNDISNITVNTNPKSNLTNKIIFFLKNYISGKKKFEILNRFKKKLFLSNELNNYFNKSNGNFKLHYIDHHISHISSAYYASKFNDALSMCFNSSVIDLDTRLKSLASLFPSSP